MIKHFTVKELVCPHVYSKFGDSAEKFLDVKLLETLEAIRGWVNVPLIVNNVTHSQRGLRCPLCRMVKNYSDTGLCFMSAHQFGMALDFHSPTMEVGNIRKIIELNECSLPHKIRMEDGRDTPTWVHIDTMTWKQVEKIKIFRV